MGYIDLRPYKPKEKKESEAELSSSESAGDFLGSLAEAGKQESESEVKGLPEMKKELLEILNILNDKLSRVEERLYRMERKLESMAFK